MGRLKYTSPSALAQGLRQRAPTLLRAGEPLVVVEGEGDRRALVPMLVGEAHVVVAGNKDMLLGAFESAGAELSASTVFIVDCDGSIDDRLKGRGNLVITANRDVDADLMFELAALDRAGPALVDEWERIQDARAAMRTALADAADAATRLGLVRTAAVGLGVPTRTVIRGARRPLALSRLEDAEGLLAGGCELEAVAGEAGRLLEWTMEQVGDVGHAAVALAGGGCRCGSGGVCTPCLTRAFCGGHLLIDALGYILHSRFGSQLSRRDLELAVRLGAVGADLTRWCVAQRLRRWEVDAGLALLQVGGGRAS